MTTAHRRWILLTVALATFMTYLDNNIVNVAIPDIQRDLRLTTAGLEWVVSAYILVFAALLLAGGRLADVFGRRRLFLVGLGVFTAASLAASLAGGVDVLIAARAAQGLGAALVTPTTLAIISATWTDPRERAGAVAAWSAVGAVALAVGPLLGGILSQDASWPWIFAINVPVGVAVLAMAVRVLPADDARVARRLDAVGLMTSALALGALTWALIEGTARGWTAASVLGALAAALVLGVAFVVVERRSADPMVDLALLANRVFAGGIVAQMLWAFGLFGIYFFTSIYLQNVLGFSPTRAGLAFVPMAACMIIGAIASDRLAVAVGSHRLVGAAMTLMGAGIGSVSLLGAHSSFGALMPSFVAIGIGGGLTTPLTASVLGVLPADQSGIASGLFNASREVAGLLGITVIGAVISAREHAVAAVGRGPVADYLSGFRLGLLLAAALVILGGASAFLVLRRSSPAVAGPQEATAVDDPPVLVGA